MHWPYNRKDWSSKPSKSATLPVHTPRDTYYYSESYLHKISIATSTHNINITVKFLGVNKGSPFPSPAPPPSQLLGSAQDCHWCSFFLSYFLVLFPQSFKFFPDVVYSSCPGFCCHARLPFLPQHQTPRCSTITMMVDIIHSLLSTSPPRPGPCPHPHGASAAQLFCRV